jgi:hypothetical protein
MLTVSVKGENKRTVFLGAFAKLRKAAVHFVMSVRPPILLSLHMKQLCSYRMDFDEI